MQYYPVFLSKNDISSYFFGMTFDGKMIFAYARALNAAFFIIIGFILMDSIKN